MRLLLGEFAEEMMERTGKKVGRREGGKKENDGWKVNREAQT